MKLDRKQLFIRLLICIALGGVMTLIIFGGLVAFLIGVGLGVVAWNIMRTIPGDRVVIEDLGKQNEWFWFVLRVPVYALALVLMWCRSDHDYLLTAPNLGNRGSEQLQASCQSHTSKVRGSAEELRRCLTTGTAQVAEQATRGAGAIFVGVEPSNFVLAILTAWILTYIPPLGIVRSRFKKQRKDEEDRRRLGKT